MLATTISSPATSIARVRVAKGLPIGDLPAALARARAQDRPALVCVRTSKDANLAVPQDIVGRFFEVYFGPAA